MAAARRRRPGPHHTHAVRHHTHPAKRVRKHATAHKPHVAGAHHPRRHK